MRYAVQIDRYTASAKNCGIVATPRRNPPHYPGDLGLRGQLPEVYFLEARDDQAAFELLVVRLGERKPLAGKSYMRGCRIVEPGK